MVRILVNLLSPESAMRDSKKLSFDTERESALLHIKHNWKWNHDIPDVDPKCFEVVWKLTEKLVRHYEGLVRGKVPWISLSRLVFAGKHKVLIFSPEKKNLGKFGEILWEFEGWVRRCWLFSVGWGGLQLIPLGLSSDWRRWIFSGPVINNKA